MAFDFEADSLSVAEALDRFEDDRARERIAAARHRAEDERRRLPPKILALAEDKSIADVYVQDNGSYIIEKAQRRSITEIFDPSPVSYSRRTPALEALRRADRDVRRVETEERARVLLDRAVAGEVLIFYWRALNDAAMVGPVSGARLAGARLMASRGDFVLQFADKSKGWKPRVVLPRAQEAAPSPPHPSRDAMRIAARAVYAEAAAKGEPPPNVAAAERIIAKRCGGGRTLIREMLADAEFAGLRRRRGEHGG